MRTRHLRPLLLVHVAGLALFTLGACSSDDSDADRGLGGNRASGGTRNGQAGTTLLSLGGSGGSSGSGGRSSTGGGSSGSSTTGGSNSTGGWNDTAGSDNQAGSEAAGEATGGAPSTAGTTGSGATGTQPLGAICANDTNCSQSDGMAVCCVNTCTLADQCAANPMYLPCNSTADCSAYGGGKLCCEVTASGQAMRFCTKQSACAGKVLP